VDNRLVCARLKGRRGSWQEMGGQNEMQARRWGEWAGNDEFLNDE
jgi:hypothetical protein